MHNTRKVWIRKKCEKRDDNGDRKSLSSCGFGDDDYIAAFLNEFLVCVEQIIDRIDLDTILSTVFRIRSNERSDKEEKKNDSHLEM
ncbi:hypothetical protein PFISCL1PPCAC_22246, partial [Pristionchus fissidentatus]